MRILFISGSFPPNKCGVGDYTSSLVQNLALLDGVTVGVLTSEGVKEDSAGPLVEVLPKIKKWNFSSFGRVLRTVREWRPDIVHIQYPTTGYGRNTMPYWIPLASGAAGTQIVQTWHEPLRWRSLYWYLPAALKRGGLVVVEPNFTDLAAAWVRPFLARKICRYIPVGPSIPRVTLDEVERAEVKSRFCSTGERLIAYFGFASPSKRIELLFTLAEPSRDRLVLLCDLSSSDPYQRMLLEMIGSEEWHKRVTVTGFLSPEEVGRILTVADAAVFPFSEGVAFRNTSFHAARNQGIFVLTTSRTLSGYNQDENVYYAVPENVAEMRSALASHAGQRVKLENGPIEWEMIAAAHHSFYRELL